MDSTDARASQHGDEAFGDHRHIKDHAVAALDAQILQGSGKHSHFIQKLRIGVGRLLAGQWAVINDGKLIAAAVLDMPIEAVPSRVAFGIWEPAVEPVNAPIGLAPGLHPIQGVGGLGPETLTVGFPALIDLMICAHGGNLPIGGECPTCAWFKQGAVNKTVV